MGCVIESNELVLPPTYVPLQQKLLGKRYSECGTGGEGVDMVMCVWIYVYACVYVFICPHVHMGWL